MRKRSLGRCAILWDIDEAALSKQRDRLAAHDAPAFEQVVDITNPGAVQSAGEAAIKAHGQVHVLINNAANDPKVDSSVSPSWSRLENFGLDMWHHDMAVGLTGAFLCAQFFGPHMAARKSGVILNIASDLSVIAPDQRLYRQERLAEEAQPVKPVTYSVIKHGLVGMTRYMAGYWADDVRVTPYRRAASMSINRTGSFSVWRSSFPWGAWRIKTSIKRPSSFCVPRHLL